MIERFENLRRELQHDPVGFYQHLSRLANEMSLSHDVQIEISLFGARVNEILSSGKGHTRIANHRLYEDGQRIIDDLIRQNDIQGDLARENNILRDFFFLKNPYTAPVFECTNLSKRLSPTFELRDFSLTLKLGEITGVVGENGNGKTTLLKIIAGELSHTSGSLSYPLLSPGKNDWSVIKQNTGYVRQTVAPWNGINSLKDQLHFVASLKGIRGAENIRLFESILSRLGLESYKTKYWNEISGGYKLRFELAKQLIWRPKLLVLDEPLANLDIKTQVTFLEDLRHITSSLSHSMAVVISSQNLYEVEKVADHLLFIRDGRPIFNSPVAEVGKSNDFCCYEIDIDMDKIELASALIHLPIREIRSNAFYKLIYTDKKVSVHEILNALAIKKARFKYFRDITHSTRLLFEK